MKPEPLEEPATVSWKYLSNEFWKLSTSEFFFLYEIFFMYYVIPSDKARVISLDYFETINRSVLNKTHRHNRHSFAPKHGITLSAKLQK